MRHPRVILGAFAFSPFRGSESAVGWNIAIRLARRFEVTVLTGDVSSTRKTGSELEKYFATHSCPEHLKIHYVPPTKSIQIIEKLHTLPGAWMFYYHAYRLWQRRAFAEAKRLHAGCPFDLAHQLTFIGYREPGYLAELGIPFVWGPLSGAENFPASFYSFLRWREAFRPLTRDLGNRIQSAFPGRPLRAARSASAIFSVSKSEQAMLTRWGIASELMLETGTSEQPLARTRPPASFPLQLVWSGIFSPRKALPLLLKALSMPELPPWNLIILGDGPLRLPWQRLADKFQLSSRIRWMGRVDRPLALQEMAKADLLIHTGLREGTPHVIIEALSLGLPVICHEAGGMGTAVDATCGMKIPLVDPATSVRGFREGILRVCKSPSLLHEWSRGALRRADDLSWDAITDRLGEAYNRILSSQDSAPLRQNQMKDP